MVLVLCRKSFLNKNLLIFEHFFFQIFDDFIQSFIPIKVRRICFTTSCLRNTSCILMLFVASWAACNRLESIPNLAAIALPIFATIGFPFTFWATNFYFTHRFLVNGRQSAVHSFSFN